MITRREKLRSYLETTMQHSGCSLIWRECLKVILSRVSHVKNTFLIFLYAFGVGIADGTILNKVPPNSIELTLSGVGSQD